MSEADQLDHFLAWEVEDESFEDVLDYARALLGPAGDVDAVDHRDRSRLYRLVFGLPSACPLVSVQALLALGADVHAGLSPLGAAVWGTDYEFQPEKAAVIDLLVAAGCDVYDHDEGGLALIESAVCPYFHGRGYRSSDGFSATSTLRLVAHGVDPNFVCDNGDTLLHRAAQDGSLDAVQGLLAAGALPDARTAAGRSAADLAAECVEDLHQSTPLRLADLGMTGVDPAIAAEVERLHRETAQTGRRHAEEALALLQAAAAPTRTTPDTRPPRPRRRR